ncbi:MAG: RNA methyltransferase [Candidatus Eremiobacteraeota bacterium]|nr:RNA methyltransferase [Candidatus Eremiobacteraeota bacterium]
MPVTLGRHSDRLMAVRALQTVKGRREQRRFCFEGTTLLQEAADAGFPIEELYATQESYASIGLVRELEGGGVATFIVSPDSAERISALTTATGVLAVGPTRMRGLAELLGPAGFVLVLADLNDPANAGTLLRSADAFGCDGVVVGSIGVDPYHPKVVRGSMGATFRLPLSVTDSRAFSDAARAASVHVVGLCATGRQIAEQEWGRPLAVVVGNERHGLGNWQAACADLVGIPMRSRVESLSAGVAGSIALFAACGNELPAKVKTTGAKSRMVY